MNAMIMAAGLGTRLRPFTDSVAKPLLPLLGVPMVQLAVDSLSQAGVKLIAINYHHLPAASRAGLVSLDFGGAGVVLSDESRKLLGSGGGITQMASLLKQGPYLLANADVLIDVDWGALRARHQLLRRLNGATITLALFRAPPWAGAYREILVDSTGQRVTGLGASRKEALFYAGAAVIESEAVAHLQVGEAFDFVPQILEPAMQLGLAGAYLSQGLWFDIGSPELWWQSHLELLQRLELGQFSGPCSKLWAKRWLATNQRLGQGIWASKRTSSRAVLESLSDWGAPSYVDLDPRIRRANLRLNRSVCYQGSSDGQPMTALSSAIAWGQHVWRADDQK